MRNNHCNFRKSEENNDYKIDEIKYDEKVLMDQHRLNNLLGLIRNDCEGFILDIQEGFIKSLSREDYEKKTIEIMKSVIERVDEIKKLK